VEVEVADPLTEWVYLAAHAAAHRYVRLSWLEDLRRLRVRESLASDDLMSRGRAMGLARVTRLGLALLGERVGDSGSIRMVMPMLFVRSDSEAADSALNAAAQAILADDPQKLMRTFQQKVFADLPKRLTRG
jgi:hypothetical protein